MATKSYKWFFDLAENLLTKDVTNDYTATVKTLLPKTIDNLADDIVKETAYNRETVIGVITLYDKKIIESVCLGEYRQHRLDALCTRTARLVHRDGGRGGPRQAETVCEHQPPQPHSARNWNR